MNVRACIYFASHNLFPRWVRSEKFRSHRRESKKKNCTDSTPARAALQRASLWPPRLAQYAAVWYGACSKEAWSIVFFSQSLQNFDEVALRFWFDQNIVSERGGGFPRGGQG
jgi:hypothetical protein